MDRLCGCGLRERLNVRLVGRVHEDTLSDPVLFSRVGFRLGDLCLLAFPASCDGCECVCVCVCV